MAIPGGIWVAIGDYAGPTLKLNDGTKAHIYVAALGASSYTFAYATPRETMANWLGATAKALDFFGGVPQLIVPDNPKAMISQSDRYEHCQKAKSTMRPASPCAA